MLAIGWVRVLNNDMHLAGSRCTEWRLLAQMQAGDMRVDRAQAGTKVGGTDGDLLGPRDCRGQQMFWLRSWWLTDSKAQLGQPYTNNNNQILRQR